MNVSRRNLIGLAAGASVFALAGCSTLSPSTIGQISSTALQGLNAIAAEITAVVPQMTQAGMPANLIGQVETVIQNIESVLQGVNSASSAATGASVLSQVEAYINTLAPIVLPFLSAVPGANVISIIVAALPAIEQGFNFFISILNSTANQVAAAAPPVTGGKFGAAAPASASPQAYLNLLVSMASKRAGHHHRVHH